MNGLANLQILKDRLSSDDSEAPIHCLFLYDNGRNCNYDCSNFRNDCPRIFNQAKKFLTKEMKEVFEPDFIGVCRAVFFCPTHDLSLSKHQTYLVHFNTLWGVASIDLRTELWNGLRKRVYNTPEPSTPRRNRPRPMNTNSAPSNIPSTHPNSGNVSARATVDSDIESPSRPRTAQAKLNTGTRYLGDLNTSIPFPGYARGSASSSSRVDPSAPKQDSGSLEPRSWGQADGSGTPISSRATKVLDGQSSPHQDKDPESQSLQEDALPVHADPSDIPKTKLNENDAPRSNPGTGFCGDAYTNFRLTSKSRTSIFGQTNPGTGFCGDAYTNFRLTSKSRTSIFGQTDPWYSSNELSFSSEFSKISLECATKIGCDSSSNWDSKLPKVPNISGDRKGKQPLKNILEQQAERFYRTIFEKLETQDNRVDANETETLRSKSRSPAPPRPHDAPIPVGPPLGDLDSEKTPIPTSVQEKSSEKAPNIPEDEQGDSDSTLRGTGSVRDEDSLLGAPEASDPPTPRSHHSKDKSTDQDASRSAKSPPVNTSPSPTSHWSSIPNRPDRGSVSSSKRATKSFEIELAIIELLKKPLTKSKKGSIVYVMEAPEFFSTFAPAASKNEQWFKIGVTSNLEARKRDLKAKCGIEDITAIATSDLNCTSEMADRIEKLCHEQLKNFQRPWTCVPQKCRNKHHREWFAVKKDEAVQTMKMWMAFMNHLPYDHDGEALSILWRDSLASRKRLFLLEEDSHRLDEIEVMNRSLEAWIRLTAEEVRNKRVGQNQV